MWNGYPLIDARALGMRGFVGRPIGMQGRHRASLGQDEASVVAQARVHLNGVSRNYRNLVSLIGKEKADEALAEAEESVRRAERSSQ